ncbi:hypothetical protein ISF_01602 [Cordyceps fumosorosea ARSEF 2679]|uniref:Beta-glucuronidase C-terminal domain-containing protein n=1 Tax=Cordyceps fumosorosea (strain ARSEF 2679) TaxID=1081104 RepID=A0A162MY68_CORFA|nr:hypothetical protein ISF_01602 [Cordyceps fumosorosea ARSEF 2679]OAA72529.1 hypothetical protein ISF_01602 [Cordyceps fumosorosea ARSEF 2679]
MAPRYTIALASALSLSGVIGVQAAAVASRDETSPLQIPRIQVDPSRYIDPSFAAFSFDQASFLSYASSPDGSKNPNALSQNLVDAVSSRTGGAPLIRLGGADADYARYVANQSALILPPPSDTPRRLGGTTVGPAYWDVAARSFPGARYVVQLPLADADMSHAAGWAMAAATRLGLDRVHSFEPGHEPDRYPAAAGLGPPTWQGAQNNGTYVANFLNYCDRVAAELALPRGTRRFQALDTASHPGGDAQQDVFALSLRSVLQQGLDNHHAVLDVARHYYQTAAGDKGQTRLETGLMNHGAVAARLEVFRDDLEFLAGRSGTRLPYVLSEVGTALGGDGAAAWKDDATLGAALWQVDVQLYGLSLGISRFHIQQDLRAGGGLWLPGVSGGDATGEVLARFYAQPFVADVVGTARTVQVKNVPLEPNISAYVAYEAGVPRRAAVVNLQYWSKCRSEATRVARWVRVQAPAGVDRVRVVHLTSPQGATARSKTVTYAGSQWTAESAGKEVKGVRNDGDVLTVAGGTVDVPVKASEAVIVHFL